MQNDVEIAEHSGAGYQPLVQYEGWLVAVLKYEERFDRANLTQLERHNLTDEVFILTEGEAQLVIGGSGTQPAPVQFIEMEKGKVYNVKKNVWHHILVSRDAAVVIVENADTAKENSEYQPIAD